MRKSKMVVCCRVCGEQLPVTGKSVLTCSECGSSSLLPPHADSEMLALYNDAFRYLSQEDFYSAIRLFEVIGKREPCAASHAGALLARYGVCGERERITGEYHQLCKRRTTSDIASDPDRSAASVSATPEERRVIASYAELIASEQERLARLEREQAEKDRAIGEDGLAREYEEAERRAAEKKAREERTLEESRRAAEEQEARRARERSRRIESARRKEKTGKILRVLLPSLFLTVVLVLLSVFLVVPSVKYKKAVNYYNAGDYTSAAILFRELGDYKNSASLLETIRFYGLSEGDTVSFGYYYYNTALVKNPIEWIVLESDEKSVLLISKYVLDVQMYNEKHISVTWEASDLRAWLNDTFLSEAFPPAEQKLILLSELTNPDTAFQHTDGGADTQDKVFILSCEEAEKYLVGRNYAVGLPSPYVTGLGIYTDDEGSGACWYWLRTPGSSQSNAAKMNYDGTVNYTGAMIHFTKYGVRPCIRVSIERLGVPID